MVTENEDIENENDMQDTLYSTSSKFSKLQ